MTLIAIAPRDGPIRRKPGTLMFSDASAAPGGKAARNAMAHREGIPLGGIDCQA
jgi:hypothetical protein